MTEIERFMEQVGMDKNVQIAFGDGDSHALAIICERKNLEIVMSWDKEKIYYENGKMLAGSFQFDKVKYFLDEEDAIEVPVLLFTGSNGASVEFREAC